MKVRKSLLVTFLIVSLISGVLYIGFRIKQKIDTAWFDAYSWTTEDKVIVPSQAENLKVKNVVETSVEDNKKTFSFTTEYCYLYEITKSEDEQNATLRCSLLPMYYMEREKEVSKEWQANSDILLVVSKNDVAPKEFLGRLDTSFESVSSLGSSAYPVSISIEGVYTYPADTFLHRISHYVLISSGKRERLTAAITEFSIKRLDKATPEQMHEYALTWSKEMHTILSAKISEYSLSSKKNSEYLDGANKLFGHLRVKCFGLNTCHEEYIGNAANNFIYSLYGMQTWNPSFYKDGVNAMKADLYPFNGMETFPVEEGNIVEGSIVHWKVFSAYEFPICPISDIESGKITPNMALLKTYVGKETVIEPSLQNKSSLVELLKSTPYSYAGLEKELSDFGGWETDRIFAVNFACSIALGGNDALSIALRDQLIATYYNMFSLFVGTKTDGSTASLEKIIYESNAYSPYSSRFISDFGVARYRESGLESNKDAADKYIEWRSALSSYIMLYLYDSRK